MGTTLEETVEMLLPYARPGGAVHKKLLTIQDQLARNVMVGPKSRKFLAALRLKLDNIECAYLVHNGRCRKKKLKAACEFRDGYTNEDGKQLKFRDCNLYKRTRPVKTNNPIKTGGE